MTKGSGRAGARKRFYRDVTVAAVAATPNQAEAFRILLDGRAAKTPAKRDLAVPSRALAEAMAREWQDQGATIEPATMPLTRIVNSALDGVTGREAAVRAAILDYAGSDLLCYLAAGPQELIERQSLLWGEIRAWLKQTFGVSLELAVGVMPVEQDAAMLALLDSAIGPRGPLELAALHVMTASMGSLVLALAVLHGRLIAADAWTLAHIDEDYQIERWGADAEAGDRRARRWTEMAAACSLLAQLQR